jgi:hypothetical protein
MTDASAELHPRTEARSAGQTAGGDKDWVGSWFKLAEEIDGEYVGMRAGRPAANGNGVAWMFLPHYDYDGAGGLVHILREERSADIAVPVLKGGDTPTKVALFAAFARFVTQKRRAAAPWQGLDASWRAPVGGTKCAGTNLATYSFDVERTKRLTESARAQGVSLNSFLLSAVARVSESELGPGPAMWMIPVNMRGLVPMRRDTGNYTSYLYIEIDRGARPGAVHEAIKRAMQRREHWATWIFLNLGRWVGERGVRWIYADQMKRVDRRICVGAFSNMGSWDGIGQWFVAPPVTYSCPLGIGVMTCDGSLSISIDTHPSIARDQAWPQAMMDRLLAQLGV